MRLHVLNPVAQTLEKKSSSAPRLSQLEGNTIGLYWNCKYGGDVSLKRVDEMLKARFAGLRTRSYAREMGDADRARDGLKRIAQECAGVIGSTAECGSCTAWLAHDMAELEKAGVPTVSFVARDFVKPWQIDASQFGVGELPKVVMAQPFAGMNAEDIHSQVDSAFEALIKMLTQPMTREAGSKESSQAAEVIAIEGEDRYDALERMNRMFLSVGWGDGFPLWAPTRERVDAMLQGARRAPGEVVAVLAPGMGLATVEKIAINAVLAGCEPEHLPVLLAAVEAISDPRFVLGNVAVSTGAHAPMMLVNGPLVQKLGINAGGCALGPGAPSAVNTVLGRAMRLIYMNLGHAYAGIMDFDTLGSPTKYSMCLGENEAASPWEPYHVEKGFDRDASVVTMFTTYALSEVEDGTGATPEAILNVTCSSACNMGPKSVGSWLLGRRGDSKTDAQAMEKHLLLVCPLHAAIYKKHGWTKQNIRDYLYEHARIPFGAFIARSSAAKFRSAHPELQGLWDSPQTLVPVLETADCFEIVVAGGNSGARSTYSYGAAEPVSRLIEQ